MANGTRASKPFTPTARALRIVRAATGLTVQAFAERVGCSDSHLKRIEDGSRNPGPDLLAEVERAFQLPPTVLLVLALRSSEVGEIDAPLTNANVLAHLARLGEER
jgi:transcriptional regulator with XRE-family HTH domain